MSDLPENWSSANILELSRMIRGVTYSKNDARDEPNNGLIPILRAMNITERGLVFDDLVYVPRKLVKDEQVIKAGDVVIAISSGSITVVGKAKQTRTDLDAAFGAFCAVLRPVAEIDPNYFGHFFGTQHYRFTVSSLARGVNINNLKRDHFEEIEIPLAPLNEQKRIAEKLDTLLARVDSCQTHLERVPQILKRFRQSVLAAATSGHLTEDWREEHNHLKTSLPFEQLTEYDDHELDELPETWGWYTFGDVASIDSNLVDPKKYQDYPHVAPNHIESKTGRLLPYGTIASDKVMSGNHLFKPGQIIYSKIRPYLCKAVVVDFAGLCSADMYPISGKYVSEKFLHKWLISEQFTSFASSQQGRTVLPKINQNALNKIPVPVPPTDEQAEIVRRVEKLFAYAERLEARYTSASEHVERLTPSLLAKAFRGELVRQE
jgi:type I restriction enzyme S subunit